MYLVVFYVGEYVCGCVGVWVCEGVCVWVCIQNRKLQNSLRSVGTCFASRSNFLLRCVRIMIINFFLDYFFEKNCALKMVSTIFARPPPNILDHPHSPQPYS
jgi:hypothetical protein